MSGCINAGMSTVLFLRNHSEFFLFLDWQFVWLKFQQVVLLAICSSVYNKLFVCGANLFVYLRWAKGDWKAYYTKWWKIFCWTDQEVHTFDLRYILIMFPWKNCLNICFYQCDSKKVHFSILLTRHCCRLMGWQHKFILSFCCVCHILHKISLCPFGLSVYKNLYIRAFPTPAEVSPDYFPF